MKKSFLTLGFSFGAAFYAMAVPFVLRNKSNKPIPLEIPGLMSPKLSPTSKSPLDLAVGQKIYFYASPEESLPAEKYLLLEVTEALAGKDLVVDELIRTRKQELGLK